MTSSKSLKCAWFGFWACCVVSALAADVVLPLVEVPAGVRYAANQLNAVTRLSVSTQVVDEGLLAGLADRGAEAFAVAPKGKGFRVTANTNAGLMYGLIELRDLLRYEKPPNKPVVSSPRLRLRGDVMDFPFYLGVDLYEGRWRHAANIEGSPDSWWLDRNHWQWRLKRCAELRINTLLLCHPHPFPALIDFPDMPEAAYFPPEHLRRLQEQFKWILDEAEQYGVKLYFLTWNIWVSPGFAKAHNLPQEGPDGDLVRAYTRACYHRLFETYPKLAGVMTMAGEAPPGCVDFVRQAIVPALNDLPQRPELLFWIWCSYPEDAKVVFDEYEGPKSLVHYLQYEQLFRPQADPRIKRASEALGGVPVVTLGGLGTATGWLYWSDPYYIRDIMADLPKQNGDGCFFQGLDSFDFVVPKWLGWQGLARYWWNPRVGVDANQPVPRARKAPRRAASNRAGGGLSSTPTCVRQDRTEDDYWRERIGEHYGNSEVAKDFLVASIAASSIPTRLLALLHRQTDHFMPQFGLPLSQYLGLPTLSTYVFENHERIDEQGRLVPRMGLTWPSPDWGEKVIGIVDFVKGERGGTTPLQIAEELQRYGEETLTRIAHLRKCAIQLPQGAEEWNRCMDQMEMNGHLGLHTGHKIRAAVAWERWRARKSSPEEVLMPLTRSVESFYRLAEISKRLYPNLQISTYRNGIGRPWPWTHLQIWTQDRWRKHDFTDSAAMFEQEREWIKHELEARYSQPLLPFEDDLAAEPKNAKLLVKWDFEGSLPTGMKINSFPPNAVAQLQDEGAPAPLSGRRLVADHNDDNFWFPLTTDPATLPLRIGKTYWVAMDYWIDHDAEALGDWLSAGARTTEGGWQKDIGARYMGGPAGTRGRITFQFSPHTWKDYYVYVCLYGRAKVELDNLEIWEGDTR